MYLKFCGIPGSEKSIQNKLSNQMARDYFPLKIEEVVADIEFEHLKPNETFRFDGADIDTYRFIILHRL